MKKVAKIASGLAGVLLVALTPARAQEVTLTVHHFLSPQSPAHKELIQPWADRVQEQSGGRIEVKVFPSMSMGGAPPELYRQVRDGAADVVWTLIGYTPGVFPRTEVFELPTVHQGDARATNLAIQDNFEQIAEDFEAVQPLLIHVHAGNAMHLVDKPVRSLKDVQGLKLRTPSRTGAWMIEAWGAEPVGMPVPDLPQALSRGTVDGALVPFEIVPPLKLHQLTEYSVEGPDGVRFGTSVFMFAMNKERYDGLPEDLRKVIDDNSGRDLAAEMGDVWNGVEEPGVRMQQESGGEVIQLSAEAKAPFDERSRQVVQRWIDEAESNGLDGAGLVETARESIGQHSQ
jgi:TRAP-type C4-dicarboxylate transport system substrate-binding protein